MIELRTKLIRNVSNLEDQVNEDKLKGYITELHIKLKNTEGEDERISVYIRCMQACLVTQFCLSL